jgi:hypothetical protein
LIECRTLNFADDEHASVTAAVRRTIAEDRHPRSPRLDSQPPSFLGGADGMIGRASREQICCETKNN